MKLLCTTRHDLAGWLAPGSGYAEEEAFSPFSNQWLLYCHDCGSGQKSKYGWERRALEGHSCAECVDHAGVPPTWTERKALLMEGET